MIVYEKGWLYAFTLDGGTTLIVRYEGRGGPHHREVWYEPSTGATLDPLPPHTDVRCLGREERSR